MPIYIYKCKECNNIIEILQKIKDEPIKKCNNCNYDALEKQLTNASFEFKGNGYYCTDFKK